MAVPLRNVLVQNRGVTQGSDVSTDLPVNPLLVVYYTLRFQQAAASDTQDKIVGLADVLGVVERLEVLFRGSTVISGSLSDLAVVSAVQTGVLPFIVAQGDATNGQRAVTVPIFLGRPALRGSECFPATRRGEFTLRRRFAATYTRVKATDVDEQVETVELLGAEPEQFLKVVSVARTWSATGDQELDLPLGNGILGVVLYGTTGYAAQTSAASWSQVRLLVDNVEHLVAAANWETLQGELRSRVVRGDEAQGHVHTENLAASYTQGAAGAKVRTSEPFLANYAYLGFDFHGAWEGVLDTTGRGRVHLRARAGTADAVRAIPVEIVRLPRAE